MPEVVLDKATVLADVYSASAPLFLIARDLGARETRAPYPYATGYHFPDGSHLGCAAPGAKVPALRLEFNPAKNPWAALHLLGHLGDRRLSRIDYAVDYPGEDINDYTFERAGVSRQEIVSRGGRLETLYLGRSSSAVMLRCYDKALEEGSAGQKMRAEAQCRYRPGETLSPAVFDKLTVRPRRVPVGLDLRDEMKVVWALNTPGWERRVSDTRTRRRIASMLDETVGVLEPQPRDVLRDQWDRILTAAEVLSDTVNNAAEAA